MRTTKISHNSFYSNLYDTFMLMRNPDQIFKRLLILLTGFIAVLSCESDSQAVAFEIQEIKDNYKSDISIFHHIAKSNSERSKRINKAIEQTILESLDPQKPSETIRAAAGTFDAAYIDFVKDYPDASEPKWELHIESELSYQSEEVITMVISIYDFQGGAHGNDQIHLLNLNAGTGVPLRKADMISDMDSFHQLAKAHFVKNLAAKQENLQMEDFFFGKPFHLPENIGYSEEGIILLYNVYEVASYAQGYTEFVIPYEEVEPYLKMY